MEDHDEKVQRRAASSERWRVAIDQEIHGKEPRLWNNIRMFARNITSRYTNWKNPMRMFEIDLHDLWYLLIQTAKITPVDGAEADRLVVQVLVIREYGQLSRLAETSQDDDNSHQAQTPENRRLEYAVTSTGARMWTDLPFLVDDLRAEWTRSIGMISNEERENLAGVTARLTASGVCTPELTSCALILFREALETPRRLLASDTYVVEDHVNDTPLSDFLPAVKAWLWYGAFQILTVCARETSSSAYGYTNEDWAAPGKLLEDSDDRVRPGFSMARWRFWKSRALEIRQNPNDKDVAELGRVCEHIMERWEQIVGGEGHDRKVVLETFFNGIVEGTED